MMTPTNAISLLLAFIVCLLGIQNIANATPQQRGLEIAKEANLRDKGFGDSQAEMTMTLKNRHGQTTTRKMRTKTLEQQDDGDKSITLFDSPSDVKGTAFLSHTHKSGPDDQWLYLPALKRVKRISSANKSGPFMGSEFSYEDLSSQEIEKYTYKYIKNETLDERDHFVIERYPVDKKSGYSKQIVWLDTKEYRAYKIEYYDRKKSHLKTLTVSELKQYLNKHWRPDTMFMENHQTGKSTRLDFSKYKFKTGLSDNNFTKNAITKMR